MRRIVPYMPPMKKCLYQAVSGPPMAILSDMVYRHIGQRTKNGKRKEGIKAPHPRLSCELPEQPNDHRHEGQGNDYREISRDRL